MGAPPKNKLHLQNLNLADSGANSNSDLLTGSGYCLDLDLVTGKDRTGRPGETVALETVFRWI